MRLWSQSLTRTFALAIVAGALAVLWLPIASQARTTDALNAVTAHCARLFPTADALAPDLDAIPGLSRLSSEALTPESVLGRMLRMALAYNRALEGIVAIDQIAPEDQLQREFSTIEAEGPWLHSEAGQGGGVAAFVDDSGLLIVVERAITTGRQGRRISHCLFIAPPGATPPVPDLPAVLRITATPSVSARGFEVSAIQGQIPLAESGEPPEPSAGFSMVTMPVPAGTPLADLAQIGGVTIFRQSISNRTSQ